MPKSVPVAHRQIISSGPTPDLYALEVLADSPVGYWRCTEGSGTTLVDSSGNSRNGTYYNSPVLINSGVNTGTTSATFSATSGQYAGVPDQSAFDITGALTLIAWVRPTSRNSIRNGIINKMSSPDTATNFELSILDDGRLFGMINDGLSPTGAIGSTVALNTWSLVCLVFTPGNHFRLYINGTQVASVATSISSLYTNSEPVRIGTLANYGANSNLIGSVCEVEVHDQALDPSRFTARINAVS